MTRVLAALLAALVLGCLLSATPGLAAGDTASGDVARAQDDVPAATADQLALLASILARPEFRAAEGRSALDRLFDPARAWLRWLIGQLLRLFFRGAQAGGDALPLGLVVISTAIVVVAGLVVRRLLLSSVVGGAETPSVRQGGPVRAADELGRARTLAESGSFRRALHHHYIAVLLKLDERDHLPFEAALTNRELLPRLTAAAELAEPFSALVARFDRLWYGQTGCTAEEYAAFAELAERVWQAADRVPPATPDRAPRRAAPAAALAAGPTAGAKP